MQANLDHVNAARVIAQPRTARHHLLMQGTFTGPAFSPVLPRPAPANPVLAFLLLPFSLLVDGAKSLLNNTPNMNSLVALGSVTR